MNRTKQLIGGVVVVVAALIGVTIKSTTDDTAEPATQIQGFVGPGFTSGGGGGGGGGGSATTSIASLTSGIPGTANGQILMWNGTTWALAPVYSSPANRAGWIDELDASGNTNCANVGTMFIGAAAGTGAGCTTTSLSGHPGMIQVATGTTTTGSVRFCTQVGSYAFGGGTGQSCTTALVRASTLSTASEEYNLRIGFGTIVTAGANPADGVFAVYDRAVTGDVWVFRTCASRSCTSQTLDGTGGTVSQPVVGGVWYLLEECVAANGASATIRVNGVLSGTITTTIPLESNSRRTGIGATVAKTAGTTGRIVDIDFIGYTLPFGVAR